MESKCTANPCAIKSLRWRWRVGLHPDVIIPPPLHVIGYSFFVQQLTKTHNGRINGQNIIDYAFTPASNSPTGPIAYGPVKPLGLNQFYPSSTTTSASNYEWYALVSTWLLVTDDRADVVFREGSLLVVQV